MEKVRIVWNGEGGELDSVIVQDDNDKNVAEALAKMIKGHVVSAGDSFTVEAVS